jgi:quercetin dioxygenase-like cupin family protein
MKVFKLSEMTKGWFVGDFEPAAMRTQAAEVAVKTYTSGSREVRHLHKLAQEVTLILHGMARMNEGRYHAGDIIVIERGEAAEFEAITNVTTVVVKVPSVMGDKYEC